MIKKPFSNILTGGSFKKNNCSNQSQLPFAYLLCHSYTLSTSRRMLSHKILEYMYVTVSKNKENVLELNSIE